MTQTISTNRSTGRTIAAAAAFSLALILVSIPGLLLGLWNAVTQQVDMNGKVWGALLLMLVLSAAPYVAAVTTLVVMLRRGRALTVALLLAALVTAVLGVPAAVVNQFVMLGGF